MISLYFHIPFCEKKCNYCSFYIIPTKDFWDWIEKLKDKYLSSLKKEIVFQKQKFNLWKEKIYTIYFGWWTPSEFWIDRYIDLLNFVKEQFDITSLQEFSLELNPKLSNDRKISDTINFIDNLSFYLKNHNIKNIRFSIWIQSLNNKILEKTNRNYNFDEINNLFSLLKNSDITLNLDFISFGVETYFDKNYFHIFSNFVSKYKDFVDSYSIYTLELFTWSIWFDSKDEKWWEKWFTNEKWWEIILDNFKKYIEILNKYWYERYEISNFSKKWKESKHNKVYWELKPYLWIWTSASWFIWNIRYTNSYGISDYIKWDFKYKEHIELTEKKILEEYIFLWLRTNNWIFLDDKVKKLLNLEKLNEYKQKWYLIENKNIVKLTNKWFDVYNYIITDLLDF